MTSPLVGIWLPIKAELEGDPAPEMALAQMQVELTAHTYCVRFGGEMADRGEYRLEKDGPFRTMIMRGMEGQNAGRTIPAIYQINGDRLRMCYGLDGVLPTEFDTVGKKRRYSVTFKRQAAAPGNE